MKQNEKGIAMLAYIMLLCLLGAVLWFLFLGPSANADVTSGKFPSEMASR